MKNSRKASFCLVLIFTTSLNFTVGCEKKIHPNQNISSIKVTQTEPSRMESSSFTELESISNIKTIHVVDDSAAAILWVPKSPHSTLSKIAFWLKQAKGYNGVIPSSQTSPDAIFNANIAPSALNINTYDRHTITIQPVWYLISNGTGYTSHYLSGVLKVVDNKQEDYIQSSQLYDWLKNDKWKAEFEIEQ